MSQFMIEFYNLSKLKHRLEKKATKTYFDSTINNLLKLRDLNA
jgi:hypothetical protein